MFQREEKQKLKSESMPALFSELRIGQWGLQACLRDGENQRKLCQILGVEGMVDQNGPFWLLEGLWLLI